MPHHNPKISVIIPAYNQAHYVAQAIQSVLVQTCPDFELIIVDDGSTDATPLIIAGIQDPRMRVIRQSNTGLSAARNAGLDQSSAPFVTFLDADDYFLPHKLELLLNFMESHPELGLGAGKPRYVDNADNVIPSSKTTPVPLKLPECLFENPICVSAILLRRTWLKQVGFFDETLRACEDWDLWLRLLAVRCPMAWIEHEVVAYRIHPGQMTSQAERMRSAIFTVLTKFFAQPGLADEIIAHKNKAFASGLVHSAAYEYLSGEWDKGKFDLAEAIRLNPSLNQQHHKKLVGLLVAWAYDPRALEPANFLQRIISHLPPGQLGLSIQLRRALADILLAPLFHGSRETRQAQRTDLMKAILFKPDWLFNRGVLRILADAWL